MWGNFVQYGYAQIHNESGSTPTVTYSNIQDGYSGTGNKNVNPLFVDATGGNVRLSGGSPCIDVGSNTAVLIDVLTDLLGNLRIADGNGDGNPVVDMGAYEYNSMLPPRNITKGQSYLTIQAAIDDADNGDQIEVSSGTYYEAINFLGKAVHVYSSGGPELTTINGTGHNHVVQCINGEGAGTILDGFTIIGGNANGPTDPDRHGGGMHNADSSPTVKNCIFKNNSASGHGGGIYNHSSSPMVISCTFIHNTAGLHGGGMMNNVSNSPTVVNSLFIQNTAVSGGGGLANSFSGNPTVINATFMNNTAAYGGGIYSYASGPTLTNCIVWDNSPNQIANDSSNPTVAYSNIQGGWSGAGTNNINAEPLFIDGAAGDLRLMRGSPCIDAGNNAVVPTGITTDRNGWSRFIDDPCTTDTGSGSGAIVDMGAYEFMPADIDYSGAVNLVDFGLTAAHWLQSGGDSGEADMNCDGIVDVADLVVLAEHWMAGL